MRYLVPIARLLVSLLFIVAVSAGQSFYSVYMDSVLDSSTETIGLVTSLGQLATAVLMLGAPAVLTRWGHAHSFVGAAIFLGLSIVPIALIGVVSFWDYSEFALIPDFVLTNYEELFSSASPTASTSRP